MKKWRWHLFGFRAHLVGSGFEDTHMVRGSRIEWFEALFATFVLHRCFRSTIPERFERACPSESDQQETQTP